MAKHILILEISQLSDDCQNHLIMHLREIETFLGIQGNVVHRIVYPATPKSSYSRHSIIYYHPQEKLYSLNGL